MATMASSFNPYQAPDATSDGAALAPDTDFLFNDKVVAGTSRILLPRICIATGATEFLVEQESQLSWCSRWIKTCQRLAVFATMFIAIPMFTHLPATKPGFSTWSEFEAFLQISCAAAIVIALIAFSAALYVFNESIHIRWYISQRVVKRNFIWRAICWVLPASPVKVRIY